METHIWLNHKAHKKVFGPYLGGSFHTKQGGVVPHPWVWSLLVSNENLDPSTKLALEGGHAWQVGTYGGNSL